MSGGSDVAATPVASVAADERQGFLREAYSLADQLLFAGQSILGPEATTFFVSAGGFAPSWLGVNAGQVLVDAGLAANIERLVFVSSIFAVSDRSTLPLDDKSTPAPVSVYGQSKLAAEAEVRRFADAGRAGISLRPPLVYDARAKGNFAALLRLAWSRLPLPFGSAHNRRSLVGLDNLVDAIMAAGGSQSALVNNLHQQIAEWNAKYADLNAKYLEALGRVGSGPLPEALSNELAEFARANAVAAGLAHRVEIRAADMAEALEPGETFVLVVADPPWVPAGETDRYPEDPLRAIDGGPDGLAVARSCLEIVGAHLAPEGRALLQLGSLQQAESLAPAIERAGLRTIDVRSHRGGVLVEMGRIAR